MRTTLTSQCKYWNNTCSYCWKFNPQNLLFHCDLQKFRQFDDPTKFLPGNLDRSESRVAIYFARAVDKPREIETSVRLVAKQRKVKRTRGE